MKFREESAGIDRIFIQRDKFTIKLIAEIEP